MSKTLGRHKFDHLEIYFDSHVLSVSVHMQLIYR